MRNGHKIPKKYLGQHFLKDNDTISRIIKTAEIGKNDLIIEIGPGRGAMTFRMAELAGRVMAIEIDHVLCKDLKERAAAYPNLTIIEGDAIEFPYEEIEARFKIVANLPYYISTPILFRLMEFRHQITSMTLMLQKEVANRIVASPGNKDYGILSIAVQFYAIPAIVFQIPPDAFYPIPEVDSALLKIIPRETVAVKVKNESLFWAVVKSAFSHRRKTLLNSLTMAGFERDTIVRTLDKIDLSSSVRPEDVNMEAWGKIADDLLDHRAGYPKYHVETEGDYVLNLDKESDRLHKYG